MATITTDTFLDEGGARTAGEAWTVNGATLTIRTDTRWHANSPAGMTGTFGSGGIGIPLGGTIKIDATKIRWMAFTGGTGTVPAIGTTVTQGGVSGYLLGVWATIDAAPSAVGSAMPATGFLKFREVTGGRYTAGALTGISATSAEADVVGWLEFVMDTGAQLASSDLGGGIQTDGGWFDLGVTTGVRGQQFAIPTNGGGSATHVFGVQIETAPGSNVYEWFPAAHPTLNLANWTTASMTTDARAKFVESLGNGVCRLGSNGTVNMGYQPPAGCRVRVPNVFLRQATAAARSVNVLTPGTRASFTGGNVSLNYAHTDIAFGILGNTFKPNIRNSVYEPTSLVLSYNKETVFLENSLFGSFTTSTGVPLSFQGMNNVVMNDVKINGLPAGGGLFVISTASSNIVAKNLEVVCAKARTASAIAIRFSDLVSDSSFTDVKLKGGNLSIATAATNVTFKNIDYIDRIEGDTTATAAQVAVSVTNCTNVMVDGLTFGEGGTINNTHPYTGVLQVSGVNNKFKARNFGTRLNPLSAGTTASLYPGYIIADATSSVGNKYQRMYLTATRLNPLVNGFSAAASNVTMEDVHVLNYTANSAEKGNNSVFRKLGLGPVPAFNFMQTNSGTHWIDYFHSDTTGSIKWVAEPPTSQTQGNNYLVVTPTQGTGFVSSSMAISLDTNGDALYSESQWKFLGHTGFQNVNPTISGAANGIVISYQIDRGTGYDGVWKVATGANLSAEQVSPTGFKMKIRIQQTGNVGSSSGIQVIIFPTTSTLQAQAENFFPLDTVTLTLEGLKPGSEVRAFVGTNPSTAVEIGGTESSGESFSFQHSSSGQQGYLHIFAMGYQPIMIPRTFAFEDSSLLIQQVIDRNYINT